MFTVRIKCHRNPKNPELVKLEIIFYRTGFNRVPKVLGITGNYSDWSNKKQCFLGKDSQNTAKNNILQKEKCKYLNLAEKWEYSGKHWSPTELSHYFDTDPLYRNKYTTVLEMIDSIIKKHKEAQRFKNGKVLSSYRTAGKYEYLRAALCRFVKNKYHRDFSKYLFRDITAKFVNDFALYEQTRGAKNGNAGGVINKLKCLRAVCRMAKDEKIYGVNLSIFIPYKRKLKQVRNNSKAISQETMKLIEQVDRSILKKNENLYLDLFLFSYYAGGMCGIDICFMEHSWVKDGMIIYERIKQDNLGKVILTDKAIELLEKYKKAGYMNYVFPIIKKKVMTQKQIYQRVNNVTFAVSKTLTKICAHLGIEENITWGTARSTFICKLIDEGFHPLQVAYMAGNSPQTIYKYYYHFTIEKDRINGIYK